MEVIETVGHARVVAVEAIPLRATSATSATSVR